VNPREYELMVAQTLQSEGWETEVTPSTGDYGVDVFARRKGSKLAVQAKMYGGSARRVNRDAVMRLYGAAAYFDCDACLIATDGEILPDAMEVARKLGVGVRMIPAIDAPLPLSHAPAASSDDFESIWERHVMPLAGRTLTRAGGSSNQILHVDWSGVKRRTSNGKEGFIPIEIFRDVVRRILRGETVTRTEINDAYPGRASSGIVLILGQVPLFEVVGSPTALRLTSRGKS
jgi:hypothetical protein